MAGKSVKFTIDGIDKTFIFSELTVNQILELVDVFKNVDDISIMGLLEKLDDFLPMLGNVTRSDLKSMAPSEIEELFDKFKSVNSSFFKVAGLLGLSEMGQEIKKAFISDFYAAFAIASAKGSSK